MGLTQAWAEGLEWAPIIEASGIDEGQLVRHLRQVIDMLQQFREIPGLGETFRARAREAAELLDRDIVKEVF
ncbi:DSHCT domain protein [compost metagenome]